MSYYNVWRRKTYIYAFEKNHKINFNITQSGDWMFYLKPFKFSIRRGFPLVLEMSMFQFHGKIILCLAVCTNKNKMLNSSEITLSNYL